MVCLDLWNNVVDIWRLFMSTMEVLRVDMRYKDVYSEEMMDKERRRWECRKLEDKFVSGFTW